MQGLSAALGTGMDEAPEGQYRAAIDQVDEVFVREGHDTGQQLAEHRVITFGGLSGRCRGLAFGVQAKQGVAQGVDLGLQHLELRTCWRAFFLGGAAPGDYIAWAVAVPIDGAALLIALRDGQVFDQLRVLRVLAPNRFANLQSSAIDGLASLAQCGEVLTSTAA